ncbi:MAG: ABC transporter permease [Oscillospiraceae bacterium]|nr:ABC transporter permease [Oscillospiraceae bacterium]
MSDFKKTLDKIGIPRLIIFLFFSFIVFLAYVNNLNVTSYIGSVLKYWGMWGVLVLAMVPSINCGVGPNFGVSLGIVCGLLGTLLVIEFDVAGAINASMPGWGSWISMFISMLISAFLAWFVGVGYGKILNSVKGSEMTVTTYIGYSVIYLMCILWFRAPFSSGEIMWPLGGKGVRNQVSMESSFGQLLNNAGGFYIGGESGVFVPTGILVFFFLMCFIVFVFFKTKTGKAISAAGENPQFARASGINVDKMRINGVAISTMLGAVGIIVYTQGFGFLQAYTAPLAMGFQCVASVLIGGATTSKARISHVIIGTFLFQGLILMTPPVSNYLLAGTDISDTVRQIIQNGVIVYALTKVKRGVSSD